MLELPQAVEGEISTVFARISGTVLVEFDTNF